MKRTLTAALVIAAAAAGLIVAGLVVQRDIRYRDLVAAGNLALESDQPFEAIEAFRQRIVAAPEKYDFLLNPGPYMDKIGKML